MPPIIDGNQEPEGDYIVKEWKPNNYNSELQRFKKAMIQTKKAISNQLRNSDLRAMKNGFLNSDLKPLSEELKNKNRQLL